MVLDCVLFYYHSLYACLLSTESQKENLSRWEEMWGGTKSNMERGNHQTIFYVKKTGFNERTYSDIWNLWSIAHSVDSWISSIVKNELIGL